jgi:hypothetical protein
MWEKESNSQERQSLYCAWRSHIAGSTTLLSPDSVEKAQVHMKVMRNEIQSTYYIGVQGPNNGFPRAERDQEWMAITCRLTFCRETLWWVTSIWESISRWLWLAPPTLLRVWWSPASILFLFPLSYGKLCLMIHKTGVLYGQLLKRSNSQGQYNVLAPVIYHQLRI